MMSVSEDGLWLRQGAANADGDPRRRWRARWQPVARMWGRLLDLRPRRHAGQTGSRPRPPRSPPGEWVITGAKRWDVTADMPERDALRHADAIRLATGPDAGPHPQQLWRTLCRGAFWTLPDHMASMETAGSRRAGYRVWMQMQLALPASAGGDGVDRRRLHHAPCPLLAEPARWC